MNKFLPGPESTAIFYPVPRKYPSPLHKKLAKLERRYEKSVGKPLTMSRILKSATAIVRKLDLLKKEEKV